MIKPLELAAAAAAVALAGAAAVAQAPGLLLNHNARTGALGNAYVLSAAESDAIFHHPGLLDAARGIALSRVAIGSDGSALSVSGAGEWLRGGVGFGLQSLTTDGHSEQAASLAYARTRIGLRLGVAAKIVDRRDSGDHDTFGVADVSIARAIGTVVLGLTGSNLGPDPTVAGGDLRLPTTLTLGAATRSRVTGPLDVILATRATWTRDLPFAFGAGVEAGYYPVTGRTFYLRTGLSETPDSGLTPLTLGGGFSGDRISFDYAYQGADTDAGADVHRVTVRWR